MTVYDKQMDAQIAAAVQSGDFIPNAGYLREVRPGARFTIGPVVVTRQWGEPVECQAYRTAERTDNGPALSSSSTVFMLPDGSKQSFTSALCGQRKWNYEIPEGRLPDWPEVRLPFPADRVPRPCGSGYSSATSETVTVTVRFPLPEVAELIPWVRQFVEAAYAAGQNPLPMLRRIWSGQWCFGRCDNGKGVIHYVPASPRPCWTGQKLVRDNDED
jgi:hypothetical protein